MFSSKAITPSLMLSNMAFRNRVRPLYFLTIRFRRVSVSRCLLSLSCRERAVRMVRCSWRSSKGIGT